MVMKSPDTGENLVHEAVRDGGRFGFVVVTQGEPVFREITNKTLRLFGIFRDANLMALAKLVF